MTLDGIPAFFKPNLRAFWAANVPLGVDHAALYSTDALRKTLSELVDFSIINEGSPRLTIGAANVETSMMHYFDSRETPITTEHIMASGALPPAFPAIKIDDQFFWDGGILSNTPVEAVFDDHPRRSGLVFAVHVWNPNGPEPKTIWDVMARQKDLQYSSRAASHIARQKQIHKLRHVISENEHPDWELGLLDPARNADYVVACNGDPVWAAMRHRKAEFTSVTSIGAPGQASCTVYKRLPN